MSALLLAVLALCAVALVWLIVRRWRGRFTIDTARGEYLDAHASNLGLVRTDEETDAATADRVWIVSAQHGLVAPSEVIAPYDLRLPKASGTVGVWADFVVRNLLAELGAQAFTVQIFAGARYADAIAVRLAMSRVPASLPLARLTQGARLAWFARERRAREGGGAR